MFERVRRKLTHLLRSCPDDRTRAGETRALRQTIRRAAHLLLVPLVESPEEILIGGQAVIEGVMMRCPHSYAVAVRRPGGDIAVTRDSLERPSEKRPWLRYPLLRGLGVLGQAMALGIRALRYSAEQALEDPGQSKKRAEGSEGKKPGLSNWVLALNLAFSVAFFILFYKFLPLYLATLLKQRYAAFENLIAFNAVDGVIRIVLFLAFLTVLAQWKEMKRLFEYHGAEHKVVWAFEKAGRADLATARASTRFHPRCGTSFLLVVMAIAMVLYMFLPFRSFAGKFAGRIVLLPVIVGASYEFIRFAAKSQGVLWRWAAQPGLWLQRITTREPDDTQLEISIRALEAAMEMERSRGGELVVA
ncbi:MAG: DUF1385 domain-containing protein [Acidobacteria bacterium]|nr:MAG: DUF1385 domain-containing protein [Acidobacteriota bacterium]